MSAGTSPNQPVVITDGVNGPVTVKPASSPAVAADKPLVVTIHPSSAAISTTLTPTNSRSGVSSAYLQLGGSTASTLNALRATVYTEPTAGAQRSMRSANVNDTSAGTGARTVAITWYNDTGAGPFVETITLNGTTWVNTVATNMQYIEKMEVVTVGSGGANAGIITLNTGTAGAGTAIGSIGVGTVLAATGDNRTFWCHHYIATGYTAQYAVISVGIQSGGSGTNGIFFTKVAFPEIPNSAEVLLGDVALVQGQYQRSFDFHPNVVGFARITAYCIPGVNNATLSCAFDWTETPT
jgi:hypothetical protein